MLQIRFWRKKHWPVLEKQSINFSCIQNVCMITPQGLFATYGNWAVLNRQSYFSRLWTSLKSSGIAYEHLRSRQSKSGFSSQLNVVCIILTIRLPVAYQSIMVLVVCLASASLVTSNCIWSLQDPARFLLILVVTLSPQQHDHQTALFLSKILNH